MLDAFPQSLPIDDVLPQIVERLRATNRLVVTAPPGAGKTTRLPLVLFPEDWAKDGKLILVEPRRIAARAAAERMASTLGERVGQTVGLRSRLDVRTSAASRIEVVTEGVFTRMILDDPALDGVSGVLFDEYHERSLDADEGLAFALDAQAVLREDLRIIVMSATLPPRLTDNFFDAEVIASDGRAHPVETRYLGYEPRQRLEDQMAAAIRMALREETGSVLAFLPGMAEITRTAERLAGVEGVEVRPLYGALSPAEQNAAIAPVRGGARKVVLATDIAESSLTIEGVRVVVDGGFARVPRFDPALGASRLETTRLSVASADQRRGRAGRTEPGVCYRLWREAEMRGFEAAPSPEIHNADLTGLALDVARWGAKSASDLRWLDPPREALLAPAQALLRSAGAIDEAGALTALGKRIGRIGLPPRLAVMVVRAADKGAGLLAAEIAAVMSERELGGRSTDIEDRLARFRNDNGPRAKAMRDLAKRWAREAGGKADGGALSAGAVLALGFPERIARTRGAGGRFVMAGGRGCVLDETERLARETWVAAADFTGAGADLRLTLAARLNEAEVEASGAIVAADEVTYDAATRSVRARRRRRLGAILLEDTPLPSPPKERVAEALLEAVRTDGLKLLGGHEALEMLAARVSLLRRTMGEPWPEGFNAVLIDRLDDWLAPVLAGARSLHDVSGGELRAAALTLLDWPLPRELDRLAPAHWETPLGRSIAIDYTADGGPAAECRVQEAYGLNTHPAVADGRAPLTLHLLSPARRPVAVTRDLPGFWRGGYADMRKDMRGRYPKHEWPEDPASAAPTTRAKPRNA